MCSVRPSRNWFALKAALALLAASCCAGEELKFAPLGDLKLESGETIRDCRLGYRAFGRLNAAKSNAILFPTWFSGNSGQLEQYIGPGRMVDSSRFYVIAVDALGNGVSTSPSNSKAQPGSKFPRFTIRDMVESQYRMLARLGIPRLRAVIGISMGGMQTFQWMASHPEFLERAVPIIGTPRLTSADLLLWQAELSAIETARSPAEGMKTVAAIHAFALTTPDYLAARTPPQTFTNYLKTQQDETAQLMAPDDWRRQLEAMMAHDIGRPFSGRMESAARAVKARTLIVVSLRDHMVNPRPALEFARLIKAKTLEVDAECGHLIFECQGEQVRSAVAAFLE